MLGPTPNGNIPSICYIKNVITRLNSQVGDYILR